MMEPADAERQASRVVPVWGRGSSALYPTAISEAGQRE